MPFFKQKNFHIGRSVVDLMEIQPINIPMIRTLTSDSQNSFCLLFPQFFLLDYIYLLHFYFKCYVRWILYYSVIRSHTSLCIAHGNLIFTNSNQSFLSLFCLLRDESPCYKAIKGSLYSFSPYISQVGNPLDCTLFTVQHKIKAAQNG